MSEDIYVELVLLPLGWFLMIEPVANLAWQEFYKGIYLIGHPYTSLFLIILYCISDILKLFHTEFQDLHIHCSEII